MTTRIINTELSDAIRKYIEESKYKGYVHKIYSIFGNNAFIFGGFARDALNQYIHKAKNDTRDLDILIDHNDINVHNEIKKLDHIEYNSFGSTKWKPQRRIEIDIVSFLDVKTNKGERPVSNIYEAVNHLDISTSAIAYNIADGEIYDGGALEAIKAKEVDILRSYSNMKHITIARAILHAYKLGFKLSSKVKESVKLNYSPQMDHQIQKYLEYKSLSDKLDIVMDEIKEIIHK